MDQAIPERTLLGILVAGVIVVTQDASESVRFFGFLAFGFAWVVMGFAAFAWIIEAQLVKMTLSRRLWVITGGAVSCALAILFFRYGKMALDEQTIFTISFATIGLLPFLPLGIFAFRRIARDRKAVFTYTVIAAVMIACNVLTPAVSEIVLTGLVGPSMRDAIRDAQHGVPRADRQGIVSLGGHGAELSIYTIEQNYITATARYLVLAPGSGKRDVALSVQRWHGAEKCEMRSHRVIEDFVYVIEDCALRG